MVKHFQSISTNQPASQSAIPTIGNSCRKPKSTSADEHRIPDDIDLRSTMSSRVRSCTKEEDSLVDGHELPYWHISVGNDKRKSELQYHRSTKSARIGSSHNSRPWTSRFRVPPCPDEVVRNGYRMLIRRHNSCCYREGEEWWSGGGDGALGRLKEEVASAAMY